MNWVEVEIDNQDSCSITCKQCHEVLTQLKHVDTYAGYSDYYQGRQSFIFLKKDTVCEGNFLLDAPKITNQKEFELMYLQKIKCSACRSEIGIYFKTVNVDNKFALQRYALDCSSIRIEQNERMKLAAFQEILLLSSQSFIKKQVAQQGEASKYSKYGYAKIFSTIKGSYLKLQKMINSQLSKPLRQLVARQRSKKQLQDGTSSQ